MFRTGVTGDGETMTDVSPASVYPIAPAEQARIKKAFTYHPPKDDQPARYVAIRDQAHELACLILASCPESRERSLALTKVEEAAMWANASIARNE